MVKDEDHTMAESEESEFVVDSMDVVRIKLVRSLSEIEDQKELRTTKIDDLGFQPLFTHQQFGDAEKLVGYTDPKVQVLYNASSLDVHVRLSYSTSITEKDPSMQPDDVTKAVADLLMKQPITMDEFCATVSKESAFQPFGEKLHQYSVDGDDGTQHCFEVWHLDWTSGDATQHIQQIQSLSFWFIDGVNYTDSDDEKWTHFVTYETVRVPSCDSLVYYFVGYASVYNYYAYPEHIRPRIGHILILPPFWKCGHGVHLLQTIYNYFIPNKHVIDITAEEPSDHLIGLRDFVDSANSMSLSSFTEDCLKKGFSTAMADEARTKLKMPKKQARRVYEILRLKATNCANLEELRAYRLDVKQRLNQRFKKNERFKMRTAQALAEDEMKTCATTDEKRMEELSNEYEELVVHYRRIINRISTHAAQLPHVAQLPLANGHH